ncbi:MAG: MBL fold metallo-hydrolase, partial [Candidatus Helarchaeota archaeon]
NILRSEKPALIDCGSNFGIGVGYLKRLLRSLNISKIHKIIITHAHFDHCQNASRIVHEFGAEVIAHRNALPILQHNKKGYEAFEYWELVEEAFPRIFRSRLSWLYRRLILMGYNFFVNRRAKKLEEVTIVNEGDIIDLGDMKLEVLYTPGHSDDSITLLEKEQRLLFTGDMIPWTPYIHTSITDFRESIQKILNCATKYRVKTLVRGHERPQAASSEINNYQMFLRDMDIAERRILALLKKSEPLTAKKMLPYIFQQFWITKYLQELESEELIKAINQKSKIVYTIP